MLRMGETLAGVTLLAFGNGSPDIFASLANTSGDTELMYTELLGAAAFVTGFVGGLIILIQPFKIVGRNNVRDVLFFLAAIVYIDHNIHDGHYSLGEGLTTVAFYLVYIVYVFAEHIWMKRRVKMLKRKSSIFSASGASNESMSEIQKEVEDLEEIVEMQIKSRRTSSVIGNLEILDTCTKDIDDDEKENLFKTFIKSMNPIDKEDWKKSGNFSKLAMILKVNFSLISSNMF